MKANTQIYMSYYEDNFSKEENLHQETYGKLRLQIRNKYGKNIFQTETTQTERRAWQSIEQIAWHFAYKKIQPNSTGLTKRKHET